MTHVQLVSISQFEKGQGLFFPKLLQYSLMNYLENSSPPPIGYIGPIEINYHRFSNDLTV